jgi:hypothetical protein
MAGIPELIRVYKIENIAALSAEMPIVTKKDIAISSLIPIPPSEKGTNEERAIRGIRLITVNNEVVIPKEFKTIKPCILSINQIPNE